jgi:hypothetical protein
MMLNSTLCKMQVHPFVMSWGFILLIGEGTSNAHYPELSPSYQIPTPKYCKLLLSGGILDKVWWTYVSVHFSKTSQQNH